MNDPLLELLGQSQPPPGNQLKPAQGADPLLGLVRGEETMPAADQPAPTAPVGGEAPMSALEKIGKGMADPFKGAAQLITHALPQSVIDAGTQLNGWMADKGLAPRIHPQGLDADISAKEADYQARRSAAGESGIDGYRLAGNITSPMNLGLGVAGGAVAPVSLLGRMGVGATLGAASGALNPVTSGNFADEKNSQLASGAVVGAALPGLGALAGKIISPEIRQSVKTLLSENVTPTMGQILGGGYQKLEDKLMSVPLLGDAIASARGKGLDEFNRAAMARALSPIGGEVPKEAGRDAVASVRTQLGNAYDNLIPRLSFKADPQFSQDMAKIGQMAQNLAPQEAAKYTSIMKQHLSKMTPAGTMTGETFKTVESALSQDAKSFSSSLDPYQRELGDALQETLTAMRSGLARSTTNPADAAALKAVNEGYANYATIRKAAGGVGATDGKYTPAQLASAVRSGDSTTGKRAYSEGRALMQDLTDAGKDALSQKYPDSGSAGRMMAGLLATGGLGAAAASNPISVAAAGATAVPYLPGGRQLMAALLAKRPDLAKPVAAAVKSGSMVLAPGAAPALGSAYNK